MLALHDPSEWLTEPDRQWMPWLYMGNSQNLDTCIWMLRNGKASSCGWTSKKHVLNNIKIGLFVQNVLIILGSMVIKWDWEGLCNHLR